MYKNIDIHVNTVSRHFENVRALHDVEIQFTRGQIHGVIGPEGSGKTTLLRIIVGLLKAHTGAVLYYSDARSVPLKELRPVIGYMSQQQSLYPDLSIGEHLDFFRSLYELPEDIYKQRRQELLHMTRLKGFVDRPAGKLSGGMYKKLGLACALLQSPSLLLLDEPTTGVDPISRREFWDMLYKLRDQNILVIITTAYMDEAERCSKVHLLEDGEIVGSGEPKDLLKKEGVRDFDEYFIKMARGGKQ